MFCTNMGKQPFHLILSGYFFSFIPYSSSHSFTHNCTSNCCHHINPLFHKTLKSCDDFLIMVCTVHISSPGLFSLACLFFFTCLNLPMTLLYAKYFLATSPFRHFLDSSRLSGCLYGTSASCPLPSLRQSHSEGA